MKALSLWQPWATLIAIGAKTYETRSWSTDYRGPLLIHASKNKSELKVALEDEFFDVLSAAGYFEGDKDLPLGCVVAVCDLATVGRVELVRDTHAVDELAFGNYGDGRFAWKLVNVRRIDGPEVRGMQGLFDIDTTNWPLVAKSGAMEQLRMF